MTTPRPTVAQHISQGTLPLHDLAAELGSDVAMLLWMTAENSAWSRFSAAMANYLNQVMAADRAEVPAGITLYYPKISTIAMFDARGDQTLHGLAEEWDCECSAIVRCTAGYSPGAVFEAGMAAYLDGVFERSHIHVPAGTVLFYVN